METKEKKSKLEKNTKTVSKVKKTTKTVEKKEVKRKKKSVAEVKMNLKYLPIEKIKTEGNFAKAICFKPEAAPIVCGVVGVLLLFINNTIARLLGVFFFAMAALVLFFVKDFKIMDIFSKGILLYGDKEAKTACFISYDDIDTWEVEHVQGHDTIQINLKNGEMIIKDSFQADKAMRAIFAFAKEKEIRYIKTQELRKKGFKLPPFLEKFRQKLFKK